jgi:hypothetical protein
MRASISNISATNPWITRPSAPSSRAINEIKHAAITNGSDTENHVPADSHLVRNGRFHKAMDLLDRAKRHVSGEEVEPDAQALQLRVMRHIEEAQHEVARAMAIVHENS